MGAQIPAGAAAAPPAPASLEALHRRAQERFGWAVHDQPSVWHVPLAQRFTAVSRLIGSERERQRAELHRDLLAIVDAPVEVLRRMAFMQATTVACQPPMPYRDQVAAVAAVNALRPGPSPADLVRQFRDKGVTITAWGDNLHIEPGDGLSADDFALLRSNKAAILQALARPRVVI